MIIVIFELLYASIDKVCVHSKARMGASKLTIKPNNG